MNDEIALRTSPEEEELARKREELALLRARLAERELFLTNLRAELSAFEGLYLRQVGILQNGTNRITTMGIDVLVSG